MIMVTRKTRRIVTAVALLFAAIAGVNYFAGLQLFFGHDETVGKVAAAMLLIAAFMLAPKIEEERQGDRS